ncbi:2190_t:CDS:1, partial [Acaulospora morrowiae]
MTVPLPELCLREVFGFLADDENESNLSRKQNIFSCILTNRYWCQTAVSFLWSDPFSINLRPEKAELLIDTYVANFSHKELEILNISHFESYAPPTFDYVLFIRTLVVSGMIETTSRWLRRKAITAEECPIIDTLSRHILRRASNIKHIVSNSLLNLFSVSDATNFMNLTELTGFGEGAPGIYASAAEVAKNIRILRFALTNNYSVTPTTVNDIASL